MLQLPFVDFLNIPSEILMAFVCVPCISSTVCLCSLCFLFSYVHLRNKFDFLNVHGIMNTSGLLQS